MVLGWVGVGVFFWGEGYMLGVGAVCNFMVVVWGCCWWYVVGGRWVKC